MDGHGANLQQNESTTKKLIKGFKLTPDGPI